MLVYHSWECQLSSQLLWQSTPFTSEIRNHSSAERQPAVMHHGVGGGGRFKADDVLVIACW